MAPSSPPFASQIAVQSQAARPVVGTIAQFLVRRRILLSAILFAALVAVDLARGVKPLDLFHDPLGVLSGFVILAGLALRSWAVGILHKNKQLTTSGPYRLIRNPLYAGSFLMMFGFCALLNNPRDVWFILGPVVLLYVATVRHEERQLARLFPEAWPAYAKSTPRFIPRLARGDLRALWRAAQWMRSREYQALCATLAALAAIKAWQVYG
jgi:protein-S-isoprenylcysteine O-methyltransferase Ste14